MNVFAGIIERFSARFFSDMTRERIRNFKKIKRAYFSLWILMTLFLISLGSEFVANDEPLYMTYKGQSYFPIFKFYPATEFGGKYKTEANYLALRDDPGFKERGGDMILPLVRHNPRHQYLDLEGPPPHAPSWKHWLGTDSSARDVFARLLYGLRISLLFALTLMVITGVVGIIIGGLQGYLAGKVDITTQRLIEIWSSLPFLYVVILIGSIYGRSFAILVGIMSLFGWIGLSYFMRAEFLRTKNMTYVKSARALGLGPVSIFFRHILPNSLTPVITILPFTLIGGIGSLTALDFLGFGMPPPTPSWGELMKQGLDNLYAPWIALSAVMTLFITLLLATFIGEGVREAFDPRADYRVE